MTQAARAVKFVFNEILACWGLGCLNQGNEEPFHGGQDGKANPDAKGDQ